MTLPRRRLPIILPFLLLAVLALGWSGFWWIAAGRLEKGIDSWIAREAAAGRIYACAERDVGGFPFRLEIDCRSPRAELPADGGPVRIAAARFFAAAHVYQPNHVIGRLQGPLTLTHSSLPRHLNATWTTADASLMGTTEALREVSLVIENLDLHTAPDGSGKGAPVAKAALFEAHARPTPDAGAGAYDMVAKLDAANVPFIDTMLGAAEPSTIELQAQVRGLDDLKPRATSERLKAFAAAGGNLRIALAKLSRGDVALQSRGEVRLDQLGRPEGRFEVAVRGADKLASLIPALGDLGPLAGAGLNLLGQKTTLDGAPARQFDVSLEGGMARLSGIPVAEVPPLY
jgi:hypothetical protein